MHSTVHIFLERAACYSKGPAVAGTKKEVFEILYIILHEILFIYFFLKHIWWR